MLHLNGKVALITGASSGIGAATAILLAKLGAHLSLTGRNDRNLLSVTSKLPKECQHESHIGDLCDENFVKSLTEATISRFGKLDILVNNAGIIEGGTIETANLDHYDRMFNINVRSVYHLTQLAVPHLIKTKGAIVNVSSVNGIRSFPGVLPYCMSKSALDQFTRCVALELAEKGVRVNSVNPGVTVTELQKRGMGLSEEDYQKWLERTKFTHALGRPGEASEIANVIAFLASSASSYITGAQIPVDGGRHALCPR